MLEAVHIPILLLLQPNLPHHLTDSVLDWAVFWKVRRPWDNSKIGGTNTARHRVVNVRTVMRSKIFPNELPMEIGAGDIVCLNIHTNIVTKVTEHIVGGANGTQTSDPASRTLDTSANMCRQSQIPRLDGKDDGHLDAVLVMHVLTDTMYRCGPPPSAVTLLLQCHPKLVNVNQPPSGHLEHTKRRRTVPKKTHAKLHIRVLRLVAFGRRSLSVTSPAFHFSSCCSRYQMG